MGVSGHRGLSGFSCGTLLTCGVLGSSLAAGLPSPAWTEPYEFTFRGTVDEVLGENFQNVTGGIHRAGDDLRGRVAYDTGSAVVVEDAFSDSQDYTFGENFEVEVEIGGVVYRAESGTSRIGDNVGLALYPYPPEYFQDSAVFSGDFGETGASGRVEVYFGDGAPLGQPRPELVTGTELPSEVGNLDFSSTESAGGRVDYPGLTSDIDLVEFLIDAESVKVGPSLAFPLRSRDDVYVNTETGGPAFLGTSPFHAPDQAYFSIDLDVNYTDSAAVLAAGSGSVYSVDGDGLGRKCSNATYACVIIDHGDGLYTEYREITTRDAAWDDLKERLDNGEDVSVAKGDEIGTLVGGTTITLANGDEIGAHLHFQVLGDVDPEEGVTFSSSQSGDAADRLRALSIGGFGIEDFDLENPGVISGGQGHLAFLHSEGDVTPGNHRVVKPGGPNVVGETTFVNTTVGDEEDGLLIVNGNMDYEVREQLVVGGEGNGEMVIESGAMVSAQDVFIGAQGGGDGILSIGGSTRPGIRESRLEAGFIGVSQDALQCQITDAQCLLNPHVGSGTLRVGEGGVVATDVLAVGNGGLLHLEDGSRIEGLSSADAGQVLLEGSDLIIGSSPGIASILGDFSMTAGRINFEIGGYEPGMFDRLNISGNALFDGVTFDVSFLDGFQPQAGDQFDFLNVGGSGIFENSIFTTNGSANGGLGFWNYGSEGLAFEASGGQTSVVPVPASLPLIIAGLLALFGLRGLRGATQA